MTLYTFFWLISRRNCFVKQDVSLISITGILNLTLSTIIHKLIWNSTQLTVDKVEKYEKFDNGT